MTDKNEFSDFEKNLRKALASEKQKGLGPGQLNALHLAIEAGSQKSRSNAKRPWWQWSLAGSVLATAMIAFVVVDRFPDSASQQTETTAAWQESKERLQVSPSKPEITAAVPAEIQKNDRGTETAALSRSKKDLAPKKPFPGKTNADKKTVKKQSGPKTAPKVQLADGASGNSGARFKSAKPSNAAPATPSPKARKQWNTPGAGPTIQTESESADKADDELASAPAAMVPPPPAKAKKDYKGTEKPSASAKDEVALSEQKLGLGGLSGSSGGSGGSGGFGSGAGGIYGKSTEGAIKSGLQPKRLVHIAEFASDGNVSATNSAKAVVRANLSQIRHCYQSFEQKSPDPSGPREGTLRINWTIDAKGLVADLKNPSGSANLIGIRDCVLARVKRWKFSTEAASKISMTVYFNKK